ncbi:MAG TPA: hypothetical protein VIW74_06770, partial [Pyrinomonadaceae bacterium]
AGSFLVAVGLLTMPHDATFNELMNQLSYSTRTRVAFGMIGLGILLSLAGTLIGMSQKQPAQSQ